jgi:hypothetical protein
MTGNTKFVGGSFTPVGDFPWSFIVTLPALAVGKLLMLQMGEIQHFTPHLEFDNRRPWVGSK